MAKMTNEVKAFSVGNEDLFLGFADYWNQYLAEKQGKTNLIYDKTVSFDEKEAKLNALLKKTIVARSGIPYAATTPVEQWFNHPTVRYETFAVVGALIDMILPEAIIDTIGIYTDVKVGGWGDSFQFDIKPRDLFVVSKAGKAQKRSEIYKQFVGTKTVVPEMHEFTVGVALYRVLAGFESLADFTAKAVLSIEAEMTKEVYTLFAATMAALTTTAPTTIDLKTTGYTQAQLVNFAQRVTAWNYGSKAMIVGTQLALVNVLPDDVNYRYTLDDTYVKLGYIPTAFGYDLLALPQVADLSTPFGTLISNNYLWILSPASQKIVHLCLEGNVLSNTTGPFDNANLTQTTTLWKSWGTVVATNAVGATLQLA